MLGPRVCQGLNDKGQLIVEVGDLPQTRAIPWTLGQREHLPAQGVFNRDAYVVDGWSWIFVEGFIDADGVGELDRIQRTCVRPYAFRYLWKKELFSAKNLPKRMISCFMLLIKQRAFHTARNRSSQRTRRFSSSPCKSMARI